MAERISVDLGKIQQKATFLQDRLEKLQDLREQGRQAFLRNAHAEAAATQWVQVSVQAMIDLAHHIIAREGWGLPSSYQESMDILVREGFLPRKARRDLHHLIRFRDRAVHLSDPIQSDEIWDLLENHLPTLEGFLAALAARYNLDAP